MIVETTQGQVRGRAEGAGLAFLGIPFARAERFRPPQQAAPWAGVRDATAFGPTAMQATPRRPGLMMSEDCLNLNLWTPAADGAKRPVLLFLHGGGHYEGSNADPNMDGPHLLQGRDAVMVSANYRLGAFGYLHLGELLGSDWASSGNCGLLDQAAALRWVRANIAAFGGDPENVTVMGQSAGGKSVAELIALPAARGLFRRAIIQSGGVQCLRDGQTADRVAGLLLAELDLAPGRARELLRLPAETLVAAQARLCEKVAFWHAWGPVVDGMTIPTGPEEAIAAGAASGLAVLIGHNREENTTRDPDPTFDESAVPHLLHWHYGANADYLLKEIYPRYRAAAPANIALSRLQTDYSYGFGALRTARLLVGAGVPTYLYRWDFADRTVAHHSIEMPYLFGVSEREDSNIGYPAQFEPLARRANGAWTQFLLEGRPGDFGLPAWPLCTAEHPLRMVLDWESRIEPAGLTHEDLRFPTQVFRL